MKALPFIFSLFFSFQGICQVDIIFPKERQVVQRNNVNYNSNPQGDGIIYVTGDYFQDFDSMMVKLEPRVTGQGTATIWKKLCERNTNPYFKGSITGKGGWYRLILNTYKSGSIIARDTVQRVGIGEVFAITGQSNAQGGNPLGYPATDDRVSSVAYDDNRTSFNKQPIGFSKMDDDSSSIGPFHFAPSVWGKLGDKLAQSLNVPILFYGCAHGATWVDIWARMALGQYTSEPTSFIRSDIGAPYLALKVVLNYYASFTGLRGVIWHQGEADHPTPPNEYKSKLETVIARSRVHSEDTKLPWMICRASYAGGGTSSNPINGQNMVINADPDVYAGPPTDHLTLWTGHRESETNVHFNMAGLLEFANLLEQYIHTDFLETSTPLMPVDFIDITMACQNGNSTVQLQAPGGYQKYAWSNRNNTNAEAVGYANACCPDVQFTSIPLPGYERLNWLFDSTSSITVPPGRYAVNVRKNTSDKILFSPFVNLNSMVFPTQPTASASLPQIRPGQSVSLTGTNCNGTYTWSSGNTGTPVSLSPAATTSYSVACKTLHCLSSYSAPVEVKVSSCFGAPLTLSGTVTASEAPYQSKQTIQSTQQINSPGGDIDYTAKNHILLSPGFQAKGGTNFEARIQDCN